MRYPAGAGHICRQLTAGDGAPVLVADFQPFNGEPRLSQLLADRIAGQPVYQVDPLEPLCEDRLYAPLHELADESAAEFLDYGVASQRIFIISHCSAAAISLRLASDLANSYDVTAILVRPTWPSAELVAGQFAELQADLSASRRPCPDLDGDPGSCVAEMAQVLRDGLKALATRLSLDEGARAFSEMLAIYRARLSFLLACRNDQPVTLPAAVTLSVLTDAPGFELPGAGSQGYQVSSLPRLERPDAVTPELADFLADQLTGRPYGKDLRERNSTTGDAGYP